MALRITVIEPAQKTGDCGGAEMQVRWGVDDNSTGWIIQVVEWVKNRRDCSDNELEPIGFTGKYWEAWKVTNGTVFIGDTDSEHRSDTFRIADQGNRTKGNATVDGTVKFFEGYNLEMPPWEENRIPLAGALPTMSTTPPGWNTTGADDHTLRSVWNCCGAEPVNDVTGAPEPEEEPEEEEEEGGGEMQEVEKIIWSCPPWTELETEAKHERETVRRQLKKLRRYDLDTIRDGIASYIERAKRSDEGYGVREMGRLFVLNRFVFSIPHQIPLGSIPFFGGWDIPVKANSINPLWPWSFTMGWWRIRLTGLFSGYGGDEYLALKEFDHYRENFGRRFGFLEKFFRAILKLIRTIVKPG